MISSVFPLIFRLVILASLLGLVLSWVVYLNSKLEPQAPSRVGLPPIDINRLQYDEALARWRAQNAAEYQIRVFDDKYGIWTLNVRGDLITVLRAPVKNGVSVDAFVPEEHLKSLTVEGLFSQAEDALGDAPKMTEASVGTYSAYSVQFDPTYGYPSIIEITEAVRPGARVAHLHPYPMKFEVKAFQILRHNAVKAP